MTQYHWDDLESFTMKENFLRKLVAGDQLTIARTEMETGSQMRPRCYPYESFIVILTGLCKVCVDGRTDVIGANQILHIPPYIEHEIEALEYTLALEIQAQSPALLFERSASLEDENYLWGV
jgi:quercetin dioxygenase-like cupin family protein